ncbi:MAG: efflux RND transporter periplasmic adaptor subunit [Sedimentisphaeraceae bacterium JB056]
MRSKNIATIILVILTAGIFVYVTAKEEVCSGHDHEHDQRVVELKAEEVCSDEHDHDSKEGHGLHDEEDGHQEDSGHEGHGHGESEHAEKIVELTEKQIEQIGLETSVAKGGTIDITTMLTGEINLNEDRMVQVVPRVEGIVVAVNKKLGDKVHQGEILAVLESRELADMKTEYLAELERYELAKLSFEREEKLWKDKISSQQEYLEIRQAFVETKIAKQSAEQKLVAIGFDKSYLKKLAEGSEQKLTRFEIKAPFDGEVISKDIVLGKLVGIESVVYVIADLDTVWIDLQVYSGDMNFIKEGQNVHVFIDGRDVSVETKIDYLGAVADAESRTILARSVADNSSGIFKPGLFVTASAAVSKTEAKVVVEKDAVQSINGEKCVFVKDEHGYEQLYVETGVQDHDSVEITSGLSVGQEYVAKGAFALKSKIVTSTLDSHAGHGH